VKDLAEGKYKLLWNSKIKICDGWEYYPEEVKLGPLPE
jgi:formamidase